MGENMCVIGYGIVGKATAETFGITKYYSRSKQTVSLEEAATCEVIFVCLPTPVTKDGKYYVNDITKTIKELSQYKGCDNATIVLRSTVYPGYTKYLQSTFGVKIVFNPEFLSEDTWKEDALRPQVVVIGSDNIKAREKIKGLYSGRFKYNEPIVTDSITAELIKLSLNVFFATKVIFANELYDYAQKVKANYETIRGVLQAHVWGSKNHFSVYHKGGRGAGGKCLHKDLEAFAHLADSAFFDIVHYRNEELLRESNKV